MSAWEQENARLAHALSALLHAEPAPIDLDVALIARAAVLAGAALVLGDVVPRTRGVQESRPRTRVPLHLLERDPIGALGAVLRRRERPSFARSPSELLDAAVRTGTPTDLWARAGRQALIAARAWQGPVADPRTAWRVVAEIAAVAEAVSVLDVDLIKVATGRPAAIRIVEATAGLRVAARAALALAEDEKHVVDAPDPRQLAIPEVDRPPTPDRAVRTAGARRTVSPSRQVGRLVDLLDGAPELTPRHVQLTAKVARDLAILVAGSPATAGSDLRIALGDLARTLHAAAHSDAGERAFTLTRPRAIELALHDLHAVTSVAFGGGPRPDHAEATRLAQRIPHLVAALSEATREQVHRRRWAIPDRREGMRPAYAFASVSEPELRPPMLDHLTDARAAGDALAARLNTVGDLGRRPALLPMRSVEALRDLCSTREQGRPRPRHPADSTHAQRPPSDRVPRL